MVKHGQFVRNRKTEPEVSGGRAALVQPGKAFKNFFFFRIRNTGTVVCDLSLIHISAKWPAG